ncbi:hypothetical protein HC723_14670 [Vibrio sp. S11_S32]|uniref:hypothetical protein n=1 Tax=Vibrio sp. S11_S32 TaxID=2720225 RepID=UPI001680E3CD|nr:hypothetical protein [Vibrio sp. S11_S32]MBD1577652.1 hypothetical protein [Vibrio sp. S11_S32]
MSANSASSKPSNASKFIPILLIGIALVVGFYAPSFYSFIKQNTAFTSTAPKWDLSRYCALSTTTCQQNNVNITLDNDIVRPLDETHIKVEWPNQTSDKLMLTLRGLEMDLGVVKFPVLKQKDGSYQGSIVLPICTYTKMTWIGSLTDSHQQKIYTSVRMEK